MKCLETEDIDLMFVDINMPDLSGVDFVRSLRNPPMVIFTTAYSEYAVQGFKVDAVDYLLKPISFEDFNRAVNKANDRFKIKNAEQTENHNYSFKSNNEFIFIKSEYKVIRINLNDVKYIESMREYVRFHMTDGKPIMSLLTIKTVESYLPSSMFMRVHRSYIVNLNKINLIERFRIVFDGDIYIPISDQYKEKFQHFLEENYAS